MAPSILYFFIEENHIILCQGRVEAELLFIGSKKWNNLFQKHKGKGIWDKPGWIYQGHVLPDQPHFLSNEMSGVLTGGEQCVLLPSVGSLAGFPTFGEMWT